VHDATLVIQSNSCTIIVHELDRITSETNSVLIFVEKLYKMQHLEGSGTPILYIGHMVLKG